MNLAKLPIGSIVERRDGQQVTFKGGGPLNRSGHFTCGDYQFYLYNGRLRIPKDSDDFMDIVKVISRPRKTT